MRNGGSLIVAECEGTRLLCALVGVDGRLADALPLLADAREEVIPGGGVAVLDSHTAQCPAALERFLSPLIW